MPRIEINAEANRRTAEKNWGDKYLQHQTIRIDQDYVCDKCGNGFMRPTWAGERRDDELIEHACTACGGVALLDIHYPAERYKLVYRKPAEVPN
jgi:DNA-directed RNA polymerase subunit RPC12/RpoP